MPCEQCKAGEVTCDLARDRVLLLDQDARVVFFAPATNGLGEVLGKRIDQLVQPEDGHYALALAKQVLCGRTAVSWLIRDVWDSRTWLTHVEPAIGADQRCRCAVASSRPVCQMIFRLSARQRQVLWELTRCLCTKRAATSLGICDATIRSHLTRAQLATRCSDLTELMRWANDMQHALSIEDEIAAYLTRRQT